MQEAEFERLPANQVDVLGPFDPGRRAHPPDLLLN
jgi:hypothetical protein